MYTAIIVALALGGPGVTPDDIAQPDLGCWFDGAEEEGLTCAPAAPGDDSDQTDVDGLALLVESEKCWVVLNWCDPPPGQPLCTCTGCSEAKCVSACLDLYNETC